MGQAKLRGSYEERKEQAIERKVKELEEKAKRKEEELKIKMEKIENMSDEERKKEWERRKRIHKTAMEFSYYLNAFHGIGVINKKG